MVNNKIREILNNKILNSSEKLEQLSLYSPICQHMFIAKRNKQFWKTTLENACLLLIEHNLDLQESLLHEKTVKVPFIGVVK